MKKRLLTVLLVAFVLCTMAINTFAIENQDGLPSILNYSLCYKAYGQYNWNNENYSARVYESGVCPDCGQNVTFINWEIPEDYQETVQWYTNNYLVIGSYYAFNYDGFGLESYRLARITRGSCEVSISGESDWYSQSDWHYLYNVLYDGWTNRLFIHSDSVPLNLVGSGYYIAIFNESNNYISSQVAGSCETLSSYLRNGTISFSLYQNRVMDWCIKNFISSPYQDILIEPYENTAYNNGYESGETNGYNSGYNIGLSDGIIEGKVLGYETGYQTGYDEGLSVNTDSAYLEGFNAGTLHGQGQVDWSFVELLDGIFYGSSHFIEPFLSLGFGDITIGSIIGLIGVVYLTLLVVRIIRK